MVYSPSSNCFFDPANTTALPADAVAVTDTQYQALMLGLSEGQLLTPNGNNVPTLTGVAGVAPLNV